MFSGNEGDPKTLSFFKKMFCTELHYTSNCRETLSLAKVLERYKCCTEGAWFEDLTDNRAFEQFPVSKRYLEVEQDV